MTLSKRCEHTQCFKRPHMEIYYLSGHVYVTNQLSFKVALLTNWSRLSRERKGLRKSIA